MPKETASLKPLASLLVLKRFQEHMLTPLEKESELSRIELEILHFLMENPGFNTAKTIIDVNHYSKSHVSGALKHLEGLGYIRRYTDAKNKKIAYLTLTDKAFELARKVKSAKTHCWKALIKDIPQENLQVMINTLEQIAANAVHEEQLRMEKSCSSIHNGSHKPLHSPMKTQI